MKCSCISVINKLLFKEIIVSLEVSGILPTLRNFSDSIPSGLCSCLSRDIVKYATEVDGVEVIFDEVHTLILSTNSSSDKILHAFPPQYIPDVSSVFLSDALSDLLKNVHLPHTIRPLQLATILCDRKYLHLSEISLLSIWSFCVDILDPKNINATYLSIKSDILVEGPQLSPQCPNIVEPFEQTISSSHDEEFVNPTIGMPSNQEHEMINDEIPKVNQYHTISTTSSTKISILEDFLKWKKRNNNADSRLSVSPFESSFSNTINSSSASARPTSTSSSVISHQQKLTETKTRNAFTTLEFRMNQVIEWVEFSKRQQSTEDTSNFLTLPRLESLFMPVQSDTGNDNENNSLTYSIEPNIDVSNKEQHNLSADSELESSSLSSSQYVSLKQSSSSHQGKDCISIRQANFSSTDNFDSVEEHNSDLVDDEIVSSTCSSGDEFEVLPHEIDSKYCFNEDDNQEQHLLSPNQIHSDIINSHQLTDDELNIKNAPMLIAFHEKLTDNENQSENNKNVDLVTNDKQNDFLHSFLPLKTTLDALSNDFKLSISKIPMSTSSFIVDESEKQECIEELFSIPAPSPQIEVRSRVAIEDHKIDETRKEICSVEDSNLPPAYEFDCEVQSEYENIPNDEVAHQINNSVDMPDMNEYNEHQNSLPDIINLERTESSSADLSAINKIVSKIDLLQSTLSYSPPIDQISLCEEDHHLSHDDEETKNKNCSLTPRDPEAAPTRREQMLYSDSKYYPSKNYDLKQNYEIHTGDDESVSSYNSSNSEHSDSDTLQSIYNDEEEKKEEVGISASINSPMYKLAIVNDSNIASMSQPARNIGDRENRSNYSYANGGLPFNFQYPNSPSKQIVSSLNPVIVSCVDKYMGFQTVNYVQQQDKNLQIEVYGNLNPFAPAITQEKSIACDQTKKITVQKSYQHEISTERINPFSPHLVSAKHLPPPPPSTSTNPFAQSNTANDDDCDFAIGKIHTSAEPLLNGIQSRAYSIDSVVTTQKRCSDSSLVDKNHMGLQLSLNNSSSSMVSSTSSKHEKRKYLMSPNFISQVTTKHAHHQKHDHHNEDYARDSTEISIFTPIEQQEQEQHIECKSQTGTVNHNVSICNPSTNNVITNHSNPFCSSTTSSSLTASSTSSVVRLHSAPTSNLVTNPFKQLLNSDKVSGLPLLNLSASASAAVNNLIQTFKQIPIPKPATQQQQQHFNNNCNPIPARAMTNPFGNHHIQPALNLQLQQSKTVDQQQQKSLLDNETCQNVLKFPFSKICDVDTASISSETSRQTDLETIRSSDASRSHFSPFPVGPSLSTASSSLGTGKVLRKLSAPLNLTASYENKKVPRQNVNILFSSSNPFVGLSSPIEDTPQTHNMTMKPSIVANSIQNNQIVKNEPQAAVNVLSSTPRSFQIEDVSVYPPNIQHLASSSSHLVSGRIRAFETAPLPSSISAQNIHSTNDLGARTNPFLKARDTSSISAFSSANIDHNTLINNQHATNLANRSTSISSSAKIMDSNFFSDWDANRRVDKTVPSNVFTQDNQDIRNDLKRNSFDGSVASARQSASSWINFESNHQPAFHNNYLPKEAVNETRIAIPTQQKKTQNDLMDDINSVSSQKSFSTNLQTEKQTFAQQPRKKQVVLESLSNLDSFPHQAKSKSIKSDINTSTTHSNNESQFVDDKNPRNISSADNSDAPSGIFAIVQKKNPDSRTIHDHVATTPLGHQVKIDKTLPPTTNEAPTGIFALRNFSSQLSTSPSSSSHHSFTNKNQNVPKMSGALSLFGGGARLVTSSVVLPGQQANSIAETPLIMPSAAQQHQTSENLSENLLGLKEFKKVIKGLPAESILSNQVNDTGSVSSSKLGSRKDGSILSVFDEMVSK